MSVQRRSIVLSVADNHRPVGRYIDRIFEGEKPGDLPVRQPSRYERAERAIDADIGQRLDRIAWAAPNAIPERGIAWTMPLPLW